jgi:hypothetical protein
VGAIVWSAGVDDAVMGKRRSTQLIAGCLYGVALELLIVIVINRMHRQLHNLIVTVSGITASAEIFQHREQCGYFLDTGDQV